MNKIASFILSPCILILTVILLICNTGQAKNYSFCLHDNPPFNYMSKNTLKGLDIDIINAITDPKKDKILIINAERSVCLNLLSESIVDVAVGNFLFTKSNNRNYKHSTVLYSDPTVLFYRAYEKKAFAVKNVSQLRNSSISVDGNSDLASILRPMKNQYNIFISPEKSIKVALSKMLDKHIDYLFSSLDTIGLEKNIPELSALTNVVLDSAKNYMDIPERELNFYYPRGWLFSKDVNKRLKIRSLDLKLHRIYKDNTLNNLLKKYDLGFLQPQKYKVNESYKEPNIKFINN